MLKKPEHPEAFQEKTFGFFLNLLCKSIVDCNVVFQVYSEVMQLCLYMYLFIFKWRKVFKIG